MLDFIVDIVASLWTIQSSVFHEMQYRLSFAGDKQVALNGGQIGCPYWGQTGCPYLGTNRLSLFGDKQVALIWGQTGCPY